MTLYAAPTETLKQHIEEVLGELEQRFLNKRALCIARLAEKIGNQRVSISEAKCAFILSHALHDAAKAYDWYQNKIRNAKDEFSVPRHEVFSAVIASKVIDRIFQLDLLHCTLITIAWHHYPLRGLAFTKIIDTMDEFVTVDEISLNVSERQELIDILEPLLKRFNCSSYIELTRIPKRLTKSEAKELLNELRKRLEEAKSNGLNRLYVLTIPILSALQVTDSLVASRNRKKSQKPPHIIDLPDVLIIKKVAETLWGTKRS